MGAGIFSRKATCPADCVFPSGPKCRSAPKARIPGQPNSWGPDGRVAAGVAPRKAPASGLEFPSGIRAGIWPRLFASSEPPGRPQIPSPPIRFPFRPHRRRKNRGARPIGDDSRTRQKGRRIPAAQPCPTIMRISNVDCDPANRFLLGSAKLFAFASAPTMPFHSRSKTPLAALRQAGRPTARHRPRGGRQRTRRVFHTHRAGPRPTSRQASRPPVAVRRCPECLNESAARPSSRSRSEAWLLQPAQDRRRLHPLMVRDRRRCALFPAAGRGGEDPHMPLADAPDIAAP